MAKLRTFQILGTRGRICLLFGGRVADVSRFGLDGGRYHSPAGGRTIGPGSSTRRSTAPVRMSGGPRVMIDRLVGDQILESFEVDPDDLARL